MMVAWRDAPLLVRESKVFFPGNEMEGFMIEICDSCMKQSKKISSGRPHENLIKVDERREFNGFKEQDYLCLACKSKFTHSTNRSDLTWTLWRG